MPDGITASRRESHFDNIVKRLRRVAGGIDRSISPPATTTRTTTTNKETAQCAL
jgi:hypothetical protein